MEWPGLDTTPVPNAGPEVWPGIDPTPAPAPTPAPEAEAETPPAPGLETVPFAPMAKQAATEEWPGLDAAQAAPAHEPSGAFGTFLKEIPKAAIGLPGEALKGVGVAAGQISDSPAQESSLYKIGTQLQKYSETWGAGEESVAAHPIAAAAGGAVGSFGAAAPAIVASAVGAPLTALGLGAGAIATFGAAAAGTTFTEALLKGADETTAAKAAGLNAIVAGGLGVLPLGAVLAPVRAYAPGMTGTAAYFLEKAVRGGVVFASVGEAQDFVGRQIAKAFYDPETGYSPDVNRILGTLIGGGIVGTVTPTQLHREKTSPVTDETLKRAGLGLTSELPPGPPGGAGGATAADLNKAAFVAPLTPDEAANFRTTTQTSEGMERLSTPPGETYGPLLPEAGPNLASLSKIREGTEEGALPPAGELVGQTGVNPTNMMEIVGRKMYGDPSVLAPTTVKEMVQNAFDAVKVLPDIVNGKIDMKINEATREMAFVDNGTGMRPEIMSGPFLEAATSHKEGDQSSGRFGLAKLLTLYENDEIGVISMRDGIVSRLQTTGKVMKDSVSRPELKPKVRFQTYESMSSGEKRLIDSILPDHRGTAVKIKVPETYVNDEGKVVPIKFPTAMLQYEVLKRSPLFAHNIEVSFNGEPVPNMGKHFPIQDYSNLFNVNFPWGSVRIYVTKDKLQVYGQEYHGQDMHILSNGIWQFTGAIPKNPLKPYSGNVPYRFYMDINPIVKASSPHYPFAMNRQAFTEGASKDFAQISNVISKMFQFKELQEESKAYGHIQYYNKDGTMTNPEAVVPEKPQATAWSVIKDTDKVEIKDGKMTVNNRLVPEMTREGLAGLKYDYRTLTIPQDRLQHTKIMLHNNVEIPVPGAGADEYIGLVSYARQRWGYRFDDYAQDVGSVFQAMREYLVQEFERRGEGDLFRDFNKLQVGVSFDESYRGASSVIPFEAAFINLSRPMIPTVENAPFSFYSTMIHEFAHYVHRNHEADWRDMMARIMNYLEPMREEFLEPLRGTVGIHADIMKGLTDVLDQRNSRAIGDSFKESRTDEERNVNRASDLALARQDTKSTSRLPERPGEGTEPPQRKSHADRVSEEVTGIAIEPPTDKGFIGFHGAANEFRTFDPSLIGTNEGTAFSPGVYIAGNPATGNFYANRNAAYYYNGQPYDAAIPQHRAALLLQEKGSRGAALEFAEQSAARGTLGKAYENVSMIDKAAAEVLRSGEPLAALERRGNLYTVEVNRPKDHFLDWNLPMNQQSEYVQRALKPAKFGDLETGEDIYALLRSVVGDEGASEKLREAGIAGMKYLDAGSRSSDGNPTQNFVLYDANDVKITHMNGKPLLDPEQRAIADVQHGVPVEDKFGKAIVNGYTVENISASEMKSFAPKGVTKVTPTRPNGYDVNDAAMKAAGVDDFPKTPITEVTEAGRKMLDGIGAPPEAKATATATDHFINWMRSIWDMRGTVDANPHIEPLVRYNAVEDRMSNKATQRQVVAEDVWRVAQKIVGDERANLYKFIDDYINRRYQPPDEVKRGIIRKPTQAEFDTLARKYNVTDKAMNTFKSMTRLYEQFIRDSMAAERVRAAGLEPNAYAKEISRIQGLEQQLLDKPFFPVSRFGLFTIVVKGPDGPTVYHTETKHEQNRLFKRVNEALKPGETIERGKMPMSAKPFSGLPMYMLEAIQRDMLPKSKESENLRNAIEQLKYENHPLKGITSKGAGRTIVPGYDGDFFRSFGSFFYHGSRYLARMEYQHFLNEALSDLHDSARTAPDPVKRAEIAQFVQDHHERLIDPRPDWARTRSFMFHMALGFRVASAATNLTQTIISTYPHLAAEFGDLQAIRMMSKVAANWNNFYKRATVAEMQDRDMRVLHELMMLGRIRGALAPELAGTAEAHNFLNGYGGDKVSTALTQFSKASSMMFELTEQMNRRIAGMATFELVVASPDNAFANLAIKHDPRLYAEMQSKGFTDTEAKAIVAAKVMIDRTQYQYSKEYRPAYLSGPIGSTVGMFKLFTHRMLWNLYNYPAASARTLLIMGVLGGMMGIPGMADLNGILKAIGWKIFGKDFDLEQAARKFAMDNLGMTEGKHVLDDPYTVVKGFASRGYGIPALADFLGEWAGVGKIPIPELDRSAAVSLNNILPVDFGMAFGPQASKDPATAWANAVSRGMGPLGSWAFNIYKAMMNVRNGPDELKRWEKLAPTFLANMSHAARIYREGGERSATGALITRFDPHDTEHMMEIIATGLGYQPFRLMKEWGRARAEQEAVVMWDMRRQVLLNQFWSASQAKDKEDLDRVRGAIKNFNDEVRGTPAAGKALTADTILKSMQTRQTAKAKTEAGVPASAANVPIVRDIRRLFPGADVDVRRVR